jgi:ubiquinone/menaquinone biosynthesis C-methylase UbiE
MRKNTKDYVSIVYNQKDRPFTVYPDKLTKYLFDRYHMKPGNKILDLGCGRGDFLNGFIKCGLIGYGIDQSDAAKEYCPEAAEILQGNIDEILPYEDATFDYIYSKSVIEHFYYPEKLVTEIYRVLKPRGLVITMTPDWEAVYKTFYEDYTHRTPFTVTSLQDILLIQGFENVKCEKFRQLPFLWRMPYLSFIFSIISKITPLAFSKRSKFIRFSKEIMLLSSAQKQLVMKDE